MSDGDAPSRDMAGTPEAEWRRLDARMILIGPVTAARHVLVPLVVGFFGLTASSGEPPLWLVPIMIAAPCAIGVLPWFVTRYRITDTRLEVHKGLIGRQTLTAPLDRIRSVDLQANLLHRVLGLEKVQIGTGVDDSRIELNALSAPDARTLRETLLARTAKPVAHDEQAPADPSQMSAASEGHLRRVGVPSAGAEGAEPQPEALLAELDWSWLRFAPFSLARFAIVAAAIGALSQIKWPFLTEEWVEGTAKDLLEIAIPLLVLGVALVVLVGWVIFSVTGYAVQWWGLRLTREGGNVNLRSGLLTTRSISVEEARVRGAELSEPLLLRLVRGAELAGWATGVGTEGVTKVLPQCPREVAVRVAGDLLEDAAPMTMSLVRHGPRARRRCHLRAQYVALALTGLSVVPVAVLALPRWPVLVVAVVTVAVAAATGEATYAHLGHALTDGHLVSGTGAWSRQRVALEREGIIGWSLEQTWFQRRAGLLTLVATTAAGHESVRIHDIPAPAAVALADAATPLLLSPWLHADTPGQLAVH